MISHNCYQTFSLSFLLLLPFIFLMSEGRFPSSSKYNLVSPISFLTAPSSPIHNLPSSIVTERLFLDLPPPSPSYASTCSVEFLGEILASSSRLQSHDLKELPFTIIVTQFSQSNSLSRGTVSPDVMGLEELRRVVSAAHPDYRVAVHFSGISLPYLVLVNFFYRFFLPSSA